ncbi:MAG: hypothetical protein HPM95_13045 [Alphaproteobacteria bacterium]|nr:hypothetical protein [Alphaproteobacteria bacterium]
MSSPRRQKRSRCNPSRSRTEAAGDDDDAGSSNSSPLERALDLTGAGVVVDLELAADAIAGWKIVNPQPALAPWLTYEYGLGPLSPYVPNLYDLLDDGIRWERLRGTHAGMAMGLRLCRLLG